LLELATLLSKTPKLLISLDIGCFIFIHPAPALTPGKPSASIIPCGSIVIPSCIINSLLLILLEEDIVKPDCFVFLLFCARVLSMVPPITIDFIDVFFITFIETAAGSTSVVFVAYIVPLVTVPKVGIIPKEITLELASMV
jgi:hypothetical protein